MSLVKLAAIFSVLAICSIPFCAIARPHGPGPGGPGHGPGGPKGHGPKHGPSPAVVGLTFGLFGPPAPYYYEPMGPPPPPMPFRHRHAPPPPAHPVMIFPY